MTESTSWPLEGADVAAFDPEVESEPEEEPELEGADVAAFDPEVESEPELELEDPLVDPPVDALVDAVVVELAAEDVSSGPQAVSASPATTRTAVERPQRAALVRMVVPLSVLTFAPVTMSPSRPRFGSNHRAGASLRRTTAASRR
jgi:hypothetical protein